MKKKFQRLRVFLFLISLIFTSISYASVFNIVPKAGTTLPTTVSSGGSVSAYYTVTNTTGSLHTGNYVKYLPPNVTQVTTDLGVANLCGSTFTLGANASCTLELSVTGPVNASDPNPQDHLFVCLGGCTTCCAGTNYPLNVSQNSAKTLASIAITPVSATINVAATQQYAASGTYSDGSSATITSSVTWASSSTGIATIASGGLATGVAAGSTNITANLNSITSNTATLTVVPAPAVNASLSSTTAASSPSITYTKQDLSGPTYFYVVFNVSAGTLSGTQTYQATLPAGTGMTFTNGNTCNLSSIVTSCSIKVEAGNTPGNYAFTLSTLTSGPSPTPSTLDITVAPYIFTTGTGAVNGVFGATTPVATQSTSVADAVCNASSGKPPGSGTYKAMITVSGAASGNRIACTSANCTTGGASENVDWPLKANTNYTWYFVGQVDYLGTTNAAAIFTPTTIDGFTGIVYGNWTGLNVDWTVGINCLNWTSSAFANEGNIGFSNQNNAQFWNGTGNPGGSVQFCSSTDSLYCVQQF